MKAILEFNLPEESEEYEITMKAGKMHSALWEISQKIFRPHRKHGYSDPTLYSLAEQPDTNKAIGLLEEMFYEILNEQGITL